jgi:hypothetical protein
LFQIAAKGSGAAAASPLPPAAADGAAAEGAVVSAPPVAPPLSTEGELLAIYRILGQLQSYVWLNYQVLLLLLKPVLLTVFMAWRLLVGVDMGVLLW